MKTVWMQNNIDLIRAILIQIRDRDSLDLREVEITVFDQIVINRHAERLYEDGFIDGTRIERDPHKGDMVLARDLTSAGHAYLTALENDGVWKKLRSTLSPAEIGMLSMQQLAGLAGDLAFKAMRRKLGLE